MDKIRRTTCVVWNELLVNITLDHSWHETLSLSNHRTVLLYRRHDGVPVTSGKPAETPASNETFTLSPCERNALYESCSCNTVNTEQTCIHHLWSSNSSDKKWWKSFDKRPHRRRTRTVFPILYNGPPLPPQNCLSRGGSGRPSKTCFLGLSQVHDPNGTSISSAVSAGLTSVTDRPTDIQTDHATPSVTTGHIYVRSTAMRPNNNNNTCTHII